ncbi:unnamed protein product, partial [Bubo scandiacus]
QHHSSNQHRGKTCTHATLSCPWQPEYLSDILPHLLTQSISAHRNQMQLIGSNCVNKLNLVPSNEESPLHCHEMTDLWPSHIPFGSKGDSHEWFEEEYVHCDDIQRDDNLQTCYTNVAAVLV